MPAIVDTTIPPIMILAFQVTATVVTDTALPTTTPIRPVLEPSTSLRSLFQL